jgi:hypothetical protein
LNVFLDGFSIELRDQEFYKYTISLNLLQV